MVNGPYLAADWSRDSCGWVGGIDVAGALDCSANQPNRRFANKNTLFKSSFLLK